MQETICSCSDLYNNQKLDTFGKRLKAARIFRNMSNAQLSRALNCDYSVIGKYEAETRKPDLQTLINISNILDINPIWLKTGKETNIVKTKNGDYTEIFLNKQKTSIGWSDGSVSLLQENELCDSINSSIEKLKLNRCIDKLELIDSLARELTKDITDYDPWK